MNPNKWTFKQGRRAKGSTFSIPVPDGYDAIEGKAARASGYPFIALPAGDDPEEDDRILYVENESLENDADFARSAIPEIMWAIAFDSHVGPSNPLAKKAIDCFLLEGDGVTCFVLIMGATFGTGFEYYVHPLSLTADFLRVVLYNEDVANERKFRDGLAKLVSGLKMNRPFVVPEHSKRLDAFVSKKTSADEIVRYFSLFEKLLRVADDMLSRDWQQLKVDSFEDLIFSVAEKRSEFLERAYRYYAKFADVMEAQKKLGAGKKDLASMGESAVLLELAIRPLFKCGDAKLEKRMVSEGHLRVPSSIAEARRRIVALAPSAQAILDKDSAEQSSYSDGEAENATGAASNGLLDYPAFILAILSDDWLWFKDEQIAWDGEHHKILGIEANTAKIDSFMDFVRQNFSDEFEDPKEVGQYVALFLNELEKDEKLRVPREMIHRNLYKAIRKGDLTGLTLANLAACGGAIKVKLSEEDFYTVVFDSRLARGIPRFFSLCARMMWDLRQTTKSLKGRPFKIMFASARNFDADQYLGTVKTAVPGAQENPNVMTVKSKPRVILPK